MQNGAFLVIRHSQFSIINFLVAAPQYRAAAQGSRHTPLCRSKN